MNDDADNGRVRLKNQKNVFVLVTWDVDPSPMFPPDIKERSVEIAASLCDELNIPATFFFTARSEHVTCAVLERLQSFGHEVGCHGLTHGDEEDYDQMAVSMQRDYIEEATELLETLAGQPIRSFRSPRVKTSAATLRLLTEYGYVADSSVCSQRIDFISSNLINLGWIFAPRRPYHPDDANAFKSGDLALWEVPVSALVVPFISTTLNIFGLSMMKILARVLYFEARRIGKPIVYLGHPIDFVMKTGRHQKFTLREFSPAYIRSHGLLLRKMLYRLNKETFQRYSRALFQYMADFSDVEFMTVDSYVRRILLEEKDAAWTP